jgi:uncharacterized protein (DUF1697 family)
VALRHAAFLRGMNVGGHRITNEELRAHLQALGFEEVQTFRASGNVIFDGGEESDEALQQRVELGLREALGYAVPTFIRSGAELRSLAAAEPFETAGTGGKLQVALLRAQPPAPAREEVLALDCPADRLAFAERALFWLPEGPMSSSTLDWKALERTLGPTTVRTKGTIEQIAARYFPASGADE